MITINKDLVAGLDIGTSSLKLIILNLTNSKIEFEVSQSTHSAKIKSENKHFDEQNVDEVVKLIDQLFDQIPKAFLNRLKGVQLCGQMHGIVFWNKQNKKHSNLITWQDARCTDNFLKNLPIQSMSDLNSGFGCATLFWLEKNPKFKDANFESYDSSGTIHDYISFLLSGKILMSTQNALSWGFFDLENGIWQQELIDYKYFPGYLLPNVDKPGCLISDLIYVGKDKLKLETRIFNALGDLQSSVYSCLENESDAVINISTSAQLCMAIAKSKYSEIKSKIPKSVSIFPYFDEKVLLVAASLNGGNVLDKFIDTILEWTVELEILNVDQQQKRRDKIWTKLIESAQDLKTENSLKFISTIFGERHDMETFGSLLNIRSDNLNLGSMFNALCEGLILNLKNMFPQQLLTEELCCKRILATGSCLIKNQIIKGYLEKEFNFAKISYKDSSDSAFGACLYLKNIFNL